jgi:hypothetical protein
VSNRRKLPRQRIRLEPGLFLLPPIGQVLDDGQGVPLCDCGRELQYVGDLVPPAAGHHR